MPNPLQGRFTITITNSDTFTGKGTFEFEGASGRFVAFDGTLLPFQAVTPDPTDPERFQCRGENRTITMSEHLHGASPPRFLFGEETFDDGRGTAIWVAEEDGTIGDE